MHAMKRSSTSGNEGIADTISNLLMLTVMLTEMFVSLQLWWPSEHFRSSLIG